MPPKKSITVLMSGGLDSAILAGSLLQKKRFVQPVYVQNGHLWETAELFWLRRFLKSLSHPRLKPLKVLSIPTNDLYPSHWSVTGKKIPDAKSNDSKVYLPGKNLLLIAKTTVYCVLNRIPVLALGPLKTNPFPDAKTSFFKQLQKTCSKGLNFNLKIETPFLNRNKKEIMKLGKNLPLHLTFSCLNPQPLRALRPLGPEAALSPRERVRVREYIHCGRCNKCAERQKAFQNAGLPDLTRYVR